MAFSSITFLCVFLPCVFILYYLIPNHRCRNILLIVASLLFYAYGEPVYIVLMIVNTILNYLLARMIHHKQWKKCALIFSIVINLGMLGVFKYTDMFLMTFNSLFGCNIPMTHLKLPIGISFFCFQSMSYVIDVYRERVKAQKNYFNILLYISFFPQLIAGPIVKYHDIEKQIQYRESSLSEIGRGMRRFTIGLAKKVLISNVLATCVDAIFASSIQDIGVLTAWIGAIAYCLQIYYDFSGYSDMAIGLGHMFGFTFQENFNHPYSAVNIQDFWRRWHISLSTWFKEYLYIPLGGNRRGKIRTCINKILVFLCTGLWHGANWTFVVWGLWHGCFLLLEEWLPIRKLPKFLTRIYTLVVVTVGFVIFRADSIGQAITYINQMFMGLHRGPMYVLMRNMTPKFVLVLLFAVVGSFPILNAIEKKVRTLSSWEHFERLTYVNSLIILLLCIFSLSSGTYNPFIYFRF